MFYIKYRSLFYLIAGKDQDCSVGFPKSWTRDAVDLLWGFGDHSFGLEAKSLCCSLGPGGPAGYSLRGVGNEVKVHQLLVVDPYRFQQSLEVGIFFYMVYSNILSQFGNHYNQKWEFYNLGSGDFCLSPNKFHI